MRSREHLSDGLRELGLEPGEERLDAALAYLDLIEKWNRVDNLTAIADKPRMITHHLLDSLSIQPALESAKRILDVGSGAGLPGIPLAIFNPQRSFTLLDAAAKRVRFMRHAVATLALRNVVVEQARVEQRVPRSRFDLIVSRAFSDLADFASLCAPLLAPQGRLLAMKGKYPAQELSDLPADFEYTVTRLQVPGLAAERHLIAITADQ